MVLLLPDGGGGLRSLSGHPHLAVTMWQPHDGRLSHLAITASSLTDAAGHHVATPWWPPVISGRHGGHMSHLEVAAKSPPQWRHFFTQFIVLFCKHIYQFFV